MNGSLKHFSIGLNTGVWGSLDNIVNNKKNMGRQNVSRCCTVETKVETSENVVHLMATRCAFK